MRDPGVGQPATHAEGFAKLPNRLIELGVIAHLPGPVLKVYSAILFAARSKTMRCYPSVKTLAQWSGVNKNKIAEATDFLQRHRLIEKHKFVMSGKPRRMYQVLDPTHPMFPDLRESCAVCRMIPGCRDSWTRDPATGRFGRRHLIPEGRYSIKSPETRYSHKSTEFTDSNKIEEDRRRRGGGLGEEKTPENGKPRNLEGLTDFLRQLKEPPSERLLSTFQRQGFSREDVLEAVSVVAEGRRRE